MTNRIHKGQVSYEEHLHGGVGEIKKEYLIGTKEYAGREGEFLRITINVGADIGFHEHKGKTETYHILSGEGVYFDGEKKFVVKPGDVFHCEDGKGHSIVNTGKEKLELIALILPV